MLVENGRITVTRWGEEACTMPCAPEPLNPLEDMLNHLCGAPSEGIRTLREYMSVMEALDRAARSAEAR